MTEPAARRPGARAVAGFALVGALALAWPMLLAAGPILFFDSGGYMRRGYLLIDTVRRALFGAERAAGSGAGADLAEAGSRIESIRSIPYDVFAYLTSATPLGVMGPPLVQAALVLAMLRLAIDRELEAPRRDIALAAAFCVCLTPLPWFASYLMPDILGAAIVAAALALVRGEERLTGFGRALLAGGLFFAVISHYGNIPFALAVIGAALAILAVQRRLRLRAALLGLLPVAAAVAANMAGGLIAFDAPSAAPRRLPILLARSIEDGPARWHLEANCATERYAICDLVDIIPDNVGTLMWGPEGITRRATLEQMDRIRAEEFVILRRAFLDYPVEQTVALLGNVGAQLVRFGTHDFLIGDVALGEGAKPTVSLSRERMRGALDAAAVAAALSAGLAVAAIALFWRQDGLRAGLREREMLAVLAFALLINAAIFGGLSAPVDRYQGRVIWLVPVLAALFWLERRRRAAPA